MQETISLTGLCRELFEEENLSGCKMDFENYCKEKRNHFAEILKAMGVNPSYLKENGKSQYRIPLTAKDTVKRMLLEYTSKPMKNIRKGSFDEIETEVLTEIVKGVEALIRDGSEESEELWGNLDDLYLTTRFAVRGSEEGIYNEVIEKILNDIKELKPIVSDKYLNELDKICLFDYYKHLLKSAIDQWQGVADVMHGLRFDEIVNEDQISGDTVFEDSETLLFQAIQSYKEEVELQPRRKLPSNDEEKKKTSEIVADIMMSINFKD